MVGLIGNESNIYGAGIYQQQIRTQIADRVAQQIDANQDDKITEEELAKAMESSGNKQGSNAEQLFKQLDQGGKGYLTRQDIADALAREEKAKSNASGQKGTAIARGAGGGGGASTTTYDPADLNQDGTVTAQERIEYILGLYTGESKQTS